MKIIALLENTSCDNTLCTEHGLSFYIESGDKKILFDTGMSGMFAENASKLAVDLSKVDFAVISHGHFDHGGGIKTFFELNNLAPIYVRKMAFDPHYSQRPDELFYNGLDQSLVPNGRFIFTDPICVIDDKLSLFSEVPHVEPLFASSKTQLEVLDGENVPDRFLHEQNLVIEEDGKYILLAGCAHSGIYNILLRFNQLYGRNPDVVIGGFHLMAPNLGKSIPDADIDELANKLLALEDTMYYTCHCTGKHAYDRLKLTLGDKIEYISTGKSINI